jgi:hypothetical protein
MHDAHGNELLAGELRKSRVQDTARQTTALAMVGNSAQVSEPAAVKVL